MGDGDSYANTCGDNGGTSRQTGDPCGRPAGWGTDFDDGKCKHHRGTSPDGESHKGNGHAATHNAHRKPEFLKSDIVGTEHEDTFHAAHEALCSRYERMHGNEPDFALKKDLEEVALAYVKRDMIDAYAVENAADGSPLVEEQVIGQDDDGRPVRVTQANKLTSLWTDLRRETRLLMRDLGLYQDPESKKAESNRDVADAFRDALQE